MRTIVDIPVAQLKGLDELCAALGISRAEAVRRAVDQFLKQQSREAVDGFGLWRRAASELPKRTARRRC